MGNVLKTLMFSIINTATVSIKPMRTKTVDKDQPSKHLKAGHYRPASETPFKLRFASGPMVARHGVLTGKGHI